METKIYDLTDRFFNNQPDFFQIVKNKLGRSRVRLVSCGAGLVILPFKSNRETDPHEVKKALGFSKDYDDLRKENNKLRHSYIVLSNELDNLKSDYCNLIDECNKLKEQLQRSEPANREKYILNDSDGFQKHVSLTKEQVDLLDYLQRMYDLDISYTRFNDIDFQIV